MRMKNIILSFVLLFATPIIYAQKIGINTDTPQTTLDVNGGIQVRKDIKLGGAAGTAGNSGVDGDGFASKGAGQSPVWAPLVSELAPGFRIAESVVLTDKVGFFDDSKTPISSLTAECLEDSDMTGWTELSGLRAEITPTRINNRLVVTLQTVGQTGAYSPVGDLVFSIGIFIDGKLKSVRPLSVLGTDLVFAIGTLFDSFEKLEPKANGDPYVIQVGVTLRYKTITGTADWRSWYVILGREHEAMSNTNAMMNMTSLKIDLYEEIVL